MARPVIPEAFLRACSVFHQDVLLVHGTIEAAARAGVEGLAEAERTDLRHFLDKVLATGNASDAKHALNRAETELFFRRADGARAVLRVMRDALGDEAATQSSAKPGGRG
ncbi:MAG: hypothetical protein KIT43_10300 [Bauldia sp.]|nr:hypothetical protein [Bauldia sp.]